VFDRGLNDWQSMEQYLDDELTIDRTCLLLMDRQILYAPCHVSSRTGSEPLLMHYCFELQHKLLQRSRFRHTTLGITLDV
jgi:hypothetical protein